MKKTLVFLIMAMLFCQLYLLAQAVGERETVPATTSASDSLNAAGAKEDSLFYRADSVSYHMTSERIHLYGNTEVRYQDSKISADSLYIDLDSEQAVTFGKTVMQDGEQILIGRDVYYDVASQTGVLQDGISRIEKGYYAGGEIRKTGANSYDIDHGSFTSCEAEEPDFWFEADQLRIYRGDKIVGRPVIAYVNHFPVFYFPFMSVSIRRGRHPGFLIPEPGYNTVDGKFLRDVAWYFPYQDYADFIVGMDIMERTGWKAKLDMNYTKRYIYNGFLQGAYQKRIDSWQTNYDWSLRAGHHHELKDKATFDVNLDFVSSKRIWESSDILDESLAERLTSSISYRKPLLGSYLNAGAVFTQDLANDRASVSLPSVSFSVPSRPVYELFTKPDRSPDAWWSNISYNYAVRLDHVGEINDPNYSFGDVIWDNTPDPAIPGAYINRHNIGIKHAFGLSYNWKLRGWLNMRQGLDYNEAWFDRDKNDANWVRGNDYSAYAATNFNLYGIRNFNNGRISSIRHIVTPSASITYNPDFSDNTVFFSFGGVGLRSGDESAMLNLSVDQKWQLKYRSGNDVKRLGDVFGLTSRASANLLQDGDKFTRISHTLSFRPGNFNLGDLRVPGSQTVLRGISFGYNAQYSFYHDPRVLNWTDWKPRGQYFSHGVSFSGSAPYKQYFSKPKNRIFDAYADPDSLQIRADDFAAQSGSDNWRVAVSQDIYSDTDILEPTSSSLRLDTAFKVTENWALSYSNYYDIKKGDTISQSFKISRALHCWKLDISYSRRNEFWEYRLVLFNTAFPDALRFQTRDTKRN